MGQYYRMCNLKKNWKLSNQPVAMTLCPYEFNNGAKLMEFSYVGNGLMMAMEWLIANKFNGMPFVCVGDYADAKITPKYNKMIVRNYWGDELPKKCEYIEIVKAALGDKYDEFIKNGRSGIEIPYDEVAFKVLENIDGIGVDGSLDVYTCASDLEDKKSCNSVYQRTKALIPKYEDIPYYKYAVNLTKKEYVIIPTFKPNKWVIHPLSLLCADGNGRGGGDYREMHDKNENLIPNDYDLVGHWAYDRIYITNDRTKVKGYKKITPHFKERF